MRLEQLVYLISIIRCRSLNKAAQQLYISQPTLSKSMEALEEELDCKLFLRTPRGTSPTPEGERVYEDACEIMKIIDSWTDLRAFLPESHGEAHLVGTATFCDFLSTDFIHYLGGRYPNLSLILHEGKRDEILERMLASDHRLGVVSIVSHQEDDPLSNPVFDPILRKQAWQADLLLRDPRAVLVSARNPLAHKAHVQLEDLKSLPLAGYSGRSDETITHYHDYFAPCAPYRLHNRSTIFHFVAENRGATIFPTITTSNDYLIRTEQIRPVQVEGLTLTDACFFLIHPNKRVLKPAERVVVEELMRFFRNLGAQHETVREERKP